MQNFKTFSVPDFVSSSQDYMVNTYCNAKNIIAQRSSHGHQPLMFKPSIKIFHQHDDLTPPHLKHTCIFVQSYLQRSVQEFLN